MAKKTEVPTGLSHLILTELNKGTSPKRLATVFSTTNKAMEQYIHDNFKQVGWEWRYK